jgi:hypothetical protein
VRVMGQRAHRSGGRGGEEQPRGRDEKRPDQLHRPFRNLRWPSATHQGQGAPSPGAA